MAGPVLDTVKRASGWSIALGILMILAGIIAIASPMFAGVLIVYVVAWTAIFNGGFTMARVTCVLESSENFPAA